VAAFLNPLFRLREITERGQAAEVIFRSQIEEQPAVSILTVRHLTTYRYRRPVTPRDHRMMLRPRDSHDLRLLSTRLNINPQPVSLRWLHDVFENSIAVASFSGSADQLQFESEIELEHFESSQPDCRIEAYAESCPFNYCASDMLDLHPFIGAALSRSAG